MKMAMILWQNESHKFHPAQHKEDMMKAYALSLVLLVLLLLGVGSVEQKSKACLGPRKRL